MQLGAGTLLFCLSQCEIPFCTLLPGFETGFPFIALCNVHQVIDIP